MPLLYRQAYKGNMQLDSQYVILLIFELAKAKQEAAHCCTTKVNCRLYYTASI